MRRSRTEWPWGLLGMIALVWGVEAFVARHRSDFLDMTSVTWGMSGRAARREAVRSEILCFGDSLLKFGLDPGAVERRTGRRSYNLAVNAGRAPASFVLLRRALEAGARPSAVLIDFEPNILARPPLVNPEWWAELVGLRECAGLAWEAGDGGFLARTAVARVFPSERYRPQIRAAILRGLQGQEVAARDDVPSLRRDAHRNRGAMVMPHRPRAPVEVAPPNEVFFPADWRCEPLNARYVRRFFKLASARRIPVFWVVTPYAPSIQAGRERLGQDATFTRFARAVRSRFPGVTVLDGRRSGYDPDVFWDGTVHLDGRGAQTLSGDVADVLKRSLDGETVSGWVDLPAYR